MRRIAAFKAYDIRGEYQKDFTPEDVGKIGFFLPSLFGAGKILVGRDGRTTSPEIFELLIRGILDAGCDVYDAGLTTTPMVYYATAKYNFPLSVQITASHNPPGHNGFKISAANAVPIGYATGLQELEKMVIEGHYEPGSMKGELFDFDFTSDYKAFMLKYLNKESSLKYGIDGSNGVANLFLESLFGDATAVINETVDGTFPGHDPNPLNPKNLEQLKKLVHDRQLDLGIIFDGDADRVMFVDENGSFISPDLMIAVMAPYFIRGRGEKALIDIRTSRSVIEYLESLGAKVTMWKVGRAFASPKLREIDGIFGGEYAGHYYFRDFYYSDSGIMAALIVLDVLNTQKAKGLNVSEFIASISKYHSSGEVNYKIHEKGKAMEALNNHFMAGEQYKSYHDFDGYRIDFNDWWYNVRPSNTEPYLRFIAEATSPLQLGNVIFEAHEILKKYGHREE